MKEGVFLQFQGARTPQKVLEKALALAAQTCPDWPSSSSQPEQRPTCTLPSSASLG